MFGFGQPKFQDKDPNTSPDGSKTWIAPEDCETEVVTAKNQNDCFGKGGIEYDPETGDCARYVPKKP